MMDALSPFLEGTNVQYAWDSTSLEKLKRCPRLYYYEMIEGWASKEENVNLRFGIEYHKALEEYDEQRLQGYDHQTSLRHTVRGLLARVRDWDPDPTTRAGNYKNPRTLLQLVIDYCDKFKDDPAQTLVREDGHPCTEVSFRFELDWGPQAAKGQQPYLLCGHLDRVVTFNDQTFVMDRKTTTTTLTPHYFDQYQPNNQMSLYTLAGQVVLHTVVKGVIIDGAQVLLEKPNNYVRGFTFRTEAQIKEWLFDLRYWLYLGEQYASTNYWPQNDTACDKYGGCPFRGVCSRDPSVRENFLKADFVQLPKEERWNPLKPR